jgi:hypothetical protein
MNMTISEFKAWIDGFEVGVSGTPPTKDQWEALKAAVASIDTGSAPSTPTTEPVATQEA